MKKILTVTGLLIFFCSINLSAQCTKGNCFNGSGTYQFDNGDIYDGQWKEGQPHGNGKYEFSNGDRYIGLFQDGKRNGNGKYFWNKGGRYVGSWVDDRRDGYGEFQWPNSATYRGYWQNGEVIDFDIKISEDTQEQPLIR